LRVFEVPPLPLHPSRSLSCAIRPFSPLVVQSWIDLTTVDIQKRICSVFDYTFPQEEDSDLDDEVEYEIDTSLEKVPTAATPRDFFDSPNFSPITRKPSLSERLRANSLETPRLRGRTYSMGRTNSIENVSDDLLNPLRRRIQSQLVEQKMRKSLNLTAGTVLRSLWFSASSALSSSHTKYP
jgi:hypothetical protein